MNAGADAVGRPLHVLLFLLALGPGGAERLAATAANHWARLGVRVTLVTYSDEAPFYGLDPRVEHRPLGLVMDSPSAVAGLRNNARRLRAVRRVVREVRPDVVLSYMDRENVTAVLATRGLGVPVAGYVVSDPAHTDLGRAWSLLRRLVYPRLDLLVVQTERARDFFPRSVRKHAVVLPNPVPDPPGSGAGDELPRPCLITVGRLVEVKDHELMLRAFARVAPGRSDWSLVIVGEGALRGRLEERVRGLGLEGRVLLPGLYPDPYRALRQAEAFVLSSRREGFPMAVCEAMSCGLPVVSVDCPSGPRELIRDGVDGLLVPRDEEALADAMARLMDDPDLRRRLGERAPEVLERYGAGAVLARLRTELERITGRD